MTLDQHVDFICSKIGQTDALSRQACAGFVQARYRMIWDSLLWRDSRCLANVTATGPTVGLPANVERVLSVRVTPAGGGAMIREGAPAFLEPVDDAAIIETFGAVIDQVGTPRFYEEFDDVDDLIAPRKLRLFPAPRVGAPAALLIAGKRPFPGLTDGSASPGLRNVDNALVTFATGDMLERQRQYGKAQAKFNEAAAHLAAMVALETRQGSQIVQLIPV